MAFRALQLFEVATALMLPPSPPRHSAPPQGFLLYTLHGPVSLCGSAFIHTQSFDIFSKETLTFQV